MTVRAEMAQVKSAALGGAGTVAVVTPSLKAHQVAGSADAVQVKTFEAERLSLPDKTGSDFPGSDCDRIGWLHGGSNRLTCCCLCHAVFGTALVAGGTATLNHYVEREHDAKMRRTANRPLPSGRLSALEALMFGVGISVAGILYLAVLVNWLTSLLGIGHVAQLPVYLHAAQATDNLGYFRRGISRSSAGADGMGCHDG